MTLDLLDRAFISHWEAIAGAPAAVTGPTEPPPSVADVGSDAPGLPRLVRLLLTRAAEEWNQLAAEVEAARTRGRRTIAVTAAERGAGCSTIVAALAHALRARGRDVTTRARPAADTPEPFDPGPAHDRRIVLVDAGVWFPCGPIRRDRLIASSIGCDAAILVRRAASTPMPAWTVALTAIGVEPLGEIVSFTDATDAENAA